MENRYEQLCYLMGEYIYELWKHNELTYQHANICFGMTKKEYKKFILGE